MQWARYNSFRTTIPCGLLKNHFCSPSNPKKNKFLHTKINGKRSHLSPRHHLFFEKKQQTCHFFVEHQGVFPHFRNFWRFANPEVGIRGTTYIELNDEGCLAEGNACLEGIAKEDTIKCLVSKDAKTRKVDVFFLRKEYEFAWICYGNILHMYIYTHILHIHVSHSTRKITLSHLVSTIASIFFPDISKHLGNPNITKRLWCFTKRHLLMIWRFEPDFGSSEARKFGSP